MSVTLKELRISKGLNQAQCAEYLGMSTRNYQNYENDAAKANTARYHAIYQKLESYGQPVVSVSIPSLRPEVLYECCHGYGLAGVGKQRGKIRQAGLLQHLAEVCGWLLRWEDLYFIRSPSNRKDNTSVSNAFRTAHRKNGLHQGADHR